MTSRAERNKIFFAVLARLAPILLMMNFKISHRTAELATPVISL